jgi:hypothetical protein
MEKSYRPDLQSTIDRPRMPAFRALVAVGGIMWPLLPVTAAAATCADHPVSARGEPSRLEILAKAKARGNWRAKVRTLPELGAAFADWYKAQDADYRCEQADGQVTCMAVGRPCHD